MKLSDMKTADQVRAESRQDPEYRAAEGALAREDGGPEGELRLVLPYLRDPLLCNWDHAVAHALADWLERAADDFAGLVKADAPDCPNCGDGTCAGHPEANWCDRCGKAVESPDYDTDPCRCWSAALATARALVARFGLDTAVQVDRIEQRIAELHANRNGYCNTCGGGHPCLTLRIVRGESEETR